MDAVRIGDQICLYCKDTNGYVFNYFTSPNDSLYVYRDQARDRPNGVPTPAAITFQVCARNRHKLTKTYRRLLTTPTEQDAAFLNKLEAAKMASKAEEEDNIGEQKRQFGRSLRYGQIIQLKQLYTEKYVHMSTTQTSLRDSNNLRVYLDENNSKHAQFRILPRYKVKSEGDLVQSEDQVVVESVKSPGQFWHCSPASDVDIDMPTNTCEINLGVQKAGFTVTEYYKLNEDEQNLVKGGSMIRLYHKELEAYLATEGSFNSPTEDLHLRIRPAHRSRPKSLHPPTSAISCWQLEPETGVTQGGPVLWQQQIRLCHVTTRLYLAIKPGGEVFLSSNNNDPKTVFRFHSVIKEREEIDFGNYARIEHVLTGLWLHGDSGKPYERKGSARQDLERGTAMLRQISSTREAMYDDVFGIQQVNPDTIPHMHRAGGMVPGLEALLKQMDAEFDIKQEARAQAALREMRNLMIVNGEPIKDRQKLLRNFKIIDLLMKVLSRAAERMNDSASRDQTTSDKVLLKLCGKVHSILETYLHGDSRKNELYCAKFFDFLVEQLNLDSQLGLQSCSMITELMRDNRKMLDRITHSVIDTVIELIKKRKNYRYLSFLSVLCQCDGVTMTDNQTYITEKWLVQDGAGVFLTELGQRISREHDVVYVSRDTGATWQPLHVFVTKSETATKTAEDYKFLEHQLELFGQLCHGHNVRAIHVITEHLEYLTWTEAYICLTEEKLPDALRAKYCDIIIELFLDVGSSVLDAQSLSFVQAEIMGTEGNRRSKRAASIATANDLTVQETLRKWITSFLRDNTDMTASLSGHNMLVEKVLRLVQCLVHHGHYVDVAEVKKLCRPLLSLMDGRNDKPFPSQKGCSKGAHEAYRKHTRYQRGPETKAVVDAKYQAMKVVELLMKMQFHQRLEKFVQLFYKVGQIDGYLCTHQNIRSLENFMEETAYFHSPKFTDILMDVAKYEYDHMVRKAMLLLCQYFSVYENLFNKAIQSQVLVTPQSLEVYQYAKQNVPLLKRVAKTKIAEDQVKQVCTILNKLGSFCHLEGDDGEDWEGKPHPANQTILVNFDILTIIEALMAQGRDVAITVNNPGIVKVIKATLRLTRSLARGHSHMQQGVFNMMDDMLTISGIDQDLALALTEVFTGNQDTCMRIVPKQISHIVRLAATSLERAPQYLDLLCAIVKIEELNLPLKRNQVCVMKYLMQNHDRLKHILNQTREERLATLTGQRGGDQLSCFLSLVELLATCAEGESEFIDSICQSFLPFGDLMEVLLHPDIGSHLKRPFLRFLRWVYIPQGGLAATGVHDLQGNCKGLLTEFANQSRRLCDYILEEPVVKQRHLLKAPAKSAVNATDDGKATFHFLFDAGLEIVEALFQQGLDFKDQEDLKEATHLLAKELAQLGYALNDLLTDETHRQALSMAVLALLQVTDIDDTAYLTSYSDEIDVKNRLNQFTQRMREEFHRRTMAPDHVSQDGDSRPVGQEFLSLVACFSGEKMDTGEEETRIGLIMKQLNISGTQLRSSERDDPDQMTLDIRCIQILRAILHERETKACVSGSGQNATDTKQHSVLNVLHGTRNTDSCVGQLEETQNKLNRLEVIAMTMPLLGSSRNDVVGQLLALHASMLQGGNHKTQQACIDFFLGTREEKFFFAIKDRIEMSMLETRERRSLAAQFVTLQQENQAEAIQRRKTVTSRRQGSFGVEAVTGSPRKSVGQGLSSQTAEALVKDMLEYKDNSHIEIVFRLLANLCDGQNTWLQDYLREQPDNWKSTDLVCHVTGFLGLFYSHMASDNLAVVLQLLESLCEMAAGNAANQRVIFDNNIVDYVNHILRCRQFQDCTDDQVLEVNGAIGNLLLNMLEETQPETTDVLEEMTNTLDLASIAEHAAECYQASKSQIKGKGDGGVTLHVGFTFYIVLKRARELMGGNRKSRVDKVFEMLERQMNSESRRRGPPSVQGNEECPDAWLEAFDFFERRTKSIEIVKDDRLQRVRFRVTDEDILREEVKDKVKLHIDRSSPSNKIRDLVTWSYDVIEDIYYQRRVQRNPLAASLIKGWCIWNYLCVLLSLVINVLMVATWQPVYHRGQVAPPSGQLPAAINDPVPILPSWYYYAFGLLAALHNVCSALVFVTYVLASKMQTPNIFNRGFRFLEYIRKTSDAPKRQSRLQTNIICYRTLYYVLFVAFSGLGSAYWGYFFAFHLLNIVFKNELLKKVILAVTLNGRSLAWTALLGIVVIYIFALGAFGFLRDAMDPMGEENQLYCGHLGECVVTVLRDGIVGDISGALRYDTMTFRGFAILSLFNFAFFALITTIWLNMILGIIIDTFSELRAKKSEREIDMKTICFICSKEAYEFDTHGKGFGRHVADDHNMWDYMFFFIHLGSRAVRDYTPLELYVYNQTKQTSFDYFPLYRALVLTSEAGDRADPKINDILDTVQAILRRQRKEEKEIYYQRESARHKAWMTKHRAEHGIDG